MFASPHVLLAHTGIAWAHTVTGDFPAEDYTFEAGPDMCLIPDPTTTRVRPWAKELATLVIHGCITFDGKPAEPLHPGAAQSDLGLRQPHLRPVRAAFQPGRALRRHLLR